MLSDIYDGFGQFAQIEHLGFLVHIVVMFIVTIFQEFWPSVLSINFFGIRVQSNSHSSYSYLLSFSSFNVQICREIFVTANRWWLEKHDIRQNTTPQKTCWMKRALKSDDKVVGQKFSPTRFSLQQYVTLDFGNKSL